MPTEVKISDVSFIQPPQPQQQSTNNRVAKNSDALDEYYSTVYGAPRPRPSIKEEDLDINDVLCGRGTKYRNSSGNIMYHTLVKHFIPAYANAIKKSEKTEIAQAIVEAVKNATPPGRFLVLEKDGFWQEIDERKAREKTSQLLRETVMVGKSNVRTMYQKKKVDRFVRDCVTKGINVEQNTVNSLVASSPQKNLMINTMLGNTVGPGMMMGPMMNPTMSPTMKNGQVMMNQNMPMNQMNMPMNMNPNLAMMGNASASASKQDASTGDVSSNEQDDVSPISNTDDADSRATGNLKDDDSTISEEESKASRTEIGNKKRATEEDSPLIPLVPKYRKKKKEESTADGSEAKKIGSEVKANQPRMSMPMAGQMQIPMQGTMVGQFNNSMMFNNRMMMMPMQSVMNMNGMGAMGKGMNKQDTEQSSSIKDDSAQSKPKDRSTRLERIRKEINSWKIKPSDETMTELEAIAKLQDEKDSKATSSKDDQDEQSVDGSEASDSASSDSPIDEDKAPKEPASNQKQNITPQQGAPMQMCNVMGQPQMVQHMNPMMQMPMNPTQNQNMMQQQMNPMMHNPMMQHQGMQMNPMQMNPMQMNPMQMNPLMLGMNPQFQQQQMMQMQAQNQSQMGLNNPVARARVVAQNVTSGSTTQ